ncbi:ankyrin repeat domain-containing protein [Coleofasciculus sp. FACHB-1120]|uniref:ankyrin repeat domain-containing protein n=1 Tax=Coleofasciculus sp. FACHB-1120 TaxID=2692783 RepID=UPI0016838CBB|nr:ankyrin repeat domain-containing protein [Coleofasciculus sp. FACHB-1120]MBD2744760.1 ankyrin repeat domain-containing protein [Coleofasciculus sp. FACHB-1120]
MNAENKIERLFKAIQSSDVEQVRQLLDSGVDANRKNYSRGQHPLVLASSIGNLDIVEALLAAGADVNAKSGIAKSLKFNPTISVSSVPGNASLGEMISEALEDAPDQAKGFFAGFTQFVDAFSDENSISSAGTNEQQNSSQDEGVEFDEEENFDEEEEKTALIVAIASGHVEVVKTLLNAGAAVNPETWDDPVPLVVAAERGQLEIVRALIAAGAEVNKFDIGNYDSTPLGMAVEHGQVEIVRALLEAGANPLGGDSSCSSLALAAEDGDIEIMQLLLKTGVDINSPKGSYTALMGAANNGQFKMVQMLVEAGADVNAWYEESNTPLCYAAYRGHREIYDYLYPLVSEDIRKYGEREIDKGVKRKERLQKKDVEEFINAAMFGKIEAVKAAIEKGIEIDAIGSNGQTALMYAANYVHIPVVQILIDAGAELDILSEEDGLGEGKTALMHVAESFFATGKRAEVVKMLVEAGANINLKGKDGRTALMWAALPGYADATQALIEAGADLDARDDEGNTAMMLAEARRHPKIVRLLKQAGALEEGMNEIALIQAVDDGNVEQVRALIQVGANVNHRIIDSTALCNAAAQGHYEIVRMLIEAGADVNQRIIEGYFNPLLYAAYEGYLDIVRALVEAGADVNAEGFCNPLEYAELGIMEGHHKGGQHAEVIELLKQAGATKSQNF